MVMVEVDPSPVSEVALYLRNQRELEEVERKSYRWLANLWLQVEEAVKRDERFHMGVGTWRAEPLAPNTTALTRGFDGKAHYGVKLKLSLDQQSAFGAFLADRNVEVAVYATDTRGSSKTENAEIRLHGYVGNANGHKVLAEKVGPTAWLSRRSQLLRQLDDRHNLHAYDSYGKLIGDVFETYFKLRLDGNDVQHVVDAIYSACCVSWPSLWEPAYGNDATSAM